MSERDVNISANIRVRCTYIREHQGEMYTYRRISERDVHISAISERDVQISANIRERCTYIGEYQREMYTCRRISDRDVHISANIRERCTYMSIRERCAHIGGYHGYMHIYRRISERNVHVFKTHSVDRRRRPATAAVDGLDRNRAAECIYCLFKGSRLPKKNVRLIF